MADGERQSLADAQRAQCHDEGRQRQIADEIAVDQTNDEPDRQRRADRDDQAPAGDEQCRNDDAAETEQRANRQIEAGGEDD